MSEEVNSKEIMDFLKPRMGARFKTWLSICAHCALCADTCHHYTANEKDPKMIPSYKVRFLKEILKKKGKVDKAYLKKVYDTIYYECNMCRRCAQYCPSFDTIRNIGTAPAIPTGCAATKSRWGPKSWASLTSTTP